MEEIWKDVNGYRGYYKVSNHGRIISTRFNKEKILKVNINGPENGNYYVGAFSIDGIRINYKVHNLVATHFIPKKSPELMINHIDGNRFNNHVSNLEWVTASENVKHGWKMGRIHHNKFSPHVYINILFLLKNKFTQKVISEWLSVSVDTVHHTKKSSA